MSVILLMQPALFLSILSQYGAPLPRASLSRASTGDTHAGLGDLEEDGANHADDAKDENMVEGQRAEAEEVAEAGDIDDG